MSLKNTMIEMSIKELINFPVHVSVSKISNSLLWKNVQSVISYILGKINAKASF